MIEGAEIGLGVAEQLSHGQAALLASHHGFARDFVKLFLDISAITSVIVERHRSTHPDLPTPVRVGFH